MKFALNPAFIASSHKYSTWYLVAANTIVYSPVWTLSLRVYISAASFSTERHTKKWILSWSESLLSRST